METAQPARLDCRYALAGAAPLGRDLVIEKGEARICELQRRSSFGLTISIPSISTARIISISESDLERGRGAASTPGQGLGPPGRAVTRAVEAAGGKVEVFYFAYGQDDTIIIADYPDAASATAMSLVGNSTGVVRVSMTPLITVEEMDRAVDKAATLPSPGPAR